ncbi:MAG: hypothetical protein RBU29_04830 [bacterium]|jgi:hypothetical protein|nr:hypothetical protein [bacterium]
MRWFMAVSLGLLFWMGGCASAEKESSYLDQYSWQREFSYDNDGMLSDFEIVDLSPYTVKHLEHDAESVEFELKELFMH